MWMRFTCISYFKARLRDRDDATTLYVFGLEILADQIFRGTKYFLESVDCKILARIETTLLNEFMEATGRAHDAKYSGDGMVNNFFYAVIPISIIG
jgi:hypothetical protein